MEDLAFITPPPVIASILDETVRISFGMASEPLVGALLRVLAASKPGGRFLELGTGTGVGTAWLLSGMNEDATLVSVDTDRESSRLRRDFWAVMRGCSWCMGTDSGIWRRSRESRLTSYLRMRCRGSMTGWNSRSGW